MRTKHLLMGALVFPIAFAACTNDEFETLNPGQQTVEGDMIELPTNFSLVGAKAEEASTRAGFDQYYENDKKYYVGWLPVAPAGGTLDANALLNEENWDKIGLAWLGNNDGYVYTNYKLYHYGWLNNGATTAEFDKCNDYVLENGVWFNGQTMNQFYRWTGTTTEGVSNFWNSSSSVYEFTKENFKAAKVDANRGLFRTNLSTIFGGDYLVYYPFNPDLKDKGYLAAVSPKEFTNVEDKEEAGKQDYQTWMGPHFFQVGKATIKGGTQASDFTLGQLSGKIAVNIAGVDEANESSEIKNISTVVLYAKKGEFYTSVELDASKINASTDASKGSQLYVAGANNATTNTLISKAYDAENGITIKKDGTQTFGFVALPTKIEDVLILVQDKDGNTSVATVTNDGWNGSFEVTPNTWTGITATIQAPTSNVLYAYDEASFTTALAKATEVAKSNNEVTINLLGTVELTNTSKSYDIPAYVTVKSMTDADKLVVTRQKGQKNVTLWVKKNATLDCDVDIQGEGCCGMAPAKMWMNGTLKADRTINNYGSEIIFGQYAESGGGVEVVIEEGAVINNAIDEENEDKTRGSITVEPYTTLSLYGTLTNDGSLTIETSGTGKVGTDGALNIRENGVLNNNFDVMLRGNLATFDQGQFNNYKDFTVKVSAQITSKGVTYQAPDASYICEVNSVNRYNDAINHDVHKTTMIRFIDTNPLPTNDYEYSLKGDIKQANGKYIDFEIAVDNSKAFKLSDDNDAATHIGKLTIVSGGFEMNHSNLTVEELNVNHSGTVARWFQIAESLTVTGDVNITKYNVSGAGVPDLQILKGITVGGNMNVVDTGVNEVVFMKGTAGIINHAIGGKMDVDANGKVAFEANTVTNITGAFENDGEVDIVNQTQVSGTDVPARVLCASFTNGADTSHWVNNTYPIVPLTNN